MLVIAKSARMLAQMCVNIGYEVLVIDCFVDSDTQHLAVQAEKVSSLAVEPVGAALKRLAADYPIAGVVYGSGFEMFPETLAFLEECWSLFGNSAAVFQQVLDKPLFFKQLVELAIPHPLVSFVRPDDEGWLLKPWRGEGGLGIRRYDSDVADDGYWQQYIEGLPMSALFLAVNGQAILVGLNRQWGMEIGFVFAGISSHAAEAVDSSLLLVWLQKLVKAYDLRGLNTLDFIFNETGCYVLEINARISASAQLYGALILKSHLQACLGEWEGHQDFSSTPSAYQVLYAVEDLRLPRMIDWPHWAVDRPELGAIIGKGQPICSIIAAGKNERQLMRNLRRRQFIIETILATGH